MKTLSGVTLVLLTLAFAACGGSSGDSDSSSTESSTTTTQEKPANENQTSSGGASAEDGKAVFTANCASCHTLAAADATGTVGPDLDSVKPDENTVKTMVENGGGAMPAFSGQLSGEEIASVSAFVADNAGK